MKLLLCTDLDRTLLPNGPHPESPGARAGFARLAAHEEVSLAYVSGRHRALIEQAIEEYAIPQPDYVIADVGSTIYRVDAGGWRHWPAWSEHIGADWAGLGHDELRALLSDVQALRLQEPEKQNIHKLSYYVNPNVARDPLMQTLRGRLEAQGVRAGLVWSVDETRHTGLLDVLPAHAGKQAAIAFLMRECGYSLEQVVFAGDSGNDIDVLASAIPAVLVANAAVEVREEAQREAARRGHAQALYLARGDYLGMNGNYSAGILEGVAHYRPEMRAWLTEAV